jgi:hypothetical protein
MVLDPRLASPVLLAMAGLRLKQRQQQAPGLPYIVVEARDGESPAEAAHRARNGRTPSEPELIMVLWYEPALPEEDHGL